VVRAVNVVAEGLEQLCGAGLVCLGDLLVADIQCIVDELARELLELGKLRRAAAQQCENDVADQRQLRRGEDVVELALLRTTLEVHNQLGNKALYLRGGEHRTVPGQLERDAEPVEAAEKHGQQLAAEFEIGGALEIALEDFIELVLIHLVDSAKEEDAQLVQRGVHLCGAARTDQALLELPLRALQLAAECLFSDFRHRRLHQELENEVPVLVLQVSQLTELLDEHLRPNRHVCHSLEKCQLFRDLRDREALSLFAELRREALANLTEGRDHHPHSLYQQRALQPDGEEK